MEIQIHWKTVFVYALFVGWEMEAISLRFFAFNLPSNTGWVPFALGATFDCWANLRFSCDVLDVWHCPSAAKCDVIHESIDLFQNIRCTSDLKYFGKRNIKSNKEYACRSRSSGVQFLRHWLLWKTVFFTGHIRHYVAEEEQSLRRLRLPVDKVYTVPCRYNAVNFHQSPHNKHPIPRPWGRGMGCMLWF